MDERSKSSRTIPSVRSNVDNLNIHKRSDNLRNRASPNLDYKAIRSPRVEQQNSDSIPYGTLEKTLNTLQNRVQEAKNELVRHNGLKAISQKLVP